MSNSILKHLSGIVLFSILFYVAMNLQQFWGATRRRGYHCDDASIKEPQLKDTIGKSLLYTLGVAVPLVVIVISEFVSLHWNTDANLNWFSSISTQLYNNLIPFLYGLATERFLKNIGKFTVARLRPFFYTACLPLTMNGIACEDDSALGLQQSAFIEKYQCSSGFVSETVFQSFPSGHSSLAFYGMVFTALYLQRYSRSCLHNVNTFGLLLPLMQILCIMVAVTVAVTRVLDFKHFLSDIIVGSLLGTTVAVIVSLYRNKYREAIHESDGEKMNLNVLQEQTADLDDASKTTCSIEMEDQ